MASVRERLDAMTEILGPDECWLWTGATGNTGTATIIISKQSRSARRVLWELEHGPVEGRALIMTTCGAKLCMNPTHHYRKSLALVDLLWQAVEKTETCWNYTGSVDHNGYGVIYQLGQHYRVHRLSYELAYGKIEGHVPGHPELEICVCHHCDNPACVNPEHLFLGDDRANQEDKVAKGRHAHGPALSEALRASHRRRGYTATPEMAQSARRLREQGRTYREIANELAVSDGRAWNMVNKDRYGSSVSRSEDR